MELTPSPDRRMVWTPEWRKAVSDSGPDGLGLRKALTCNFERVEKEDGQTGGDAYEFVISSATEDRYGDTIAVDGWSAENFLKAGGPVLWSHDHTIPPVGKSAKIWSDGEALRGAVEFAPEDIHPFGHMIGKMVGWGCPGSASVGFQPIEFEESEKGFDFIKQDLLEFSVVTVPANPDAVVQMKSAGIDLEPLDEWARKTLEGIHGSVAIVEEAKLKAIVRALGYGRGMRFFDLEPTEIREKVKAKVKAESLEVVEAETTEEVLDAIQEVRAELDQIRADLVAEREALAARLETVEDDGEEVFYFDDEEDWTVEKSVEDEPPEDVVDISMEDLQSIKLEIQEQIKSQHEKHDKQFRQLLTSITGKVYD